jgi:hypothetical protein
MNLRAQVEAVEQANSRSSAHAIFTNYGKARTQEVPATSTEKKLTRVPFEVSRLMEFCTERELINQTGHDVWEWPLVVLKELVDNGLDEAEEAGLPPVIHVDVDGHKITVTDYGRGIPAKVIEKVMDYSIRVSSREAYVSPTRGAQRNALKTILPMAYVLNQHLGEEACGTTIIESHGRAHHIEFSVDHIRQEPKIRHTTRPSLIIGGTKIAVELPTPTQRYASNPAMEAHKSSFLRLAQSFGWLNPH